MSALSLAISSPPVTVIPAPTWLAVNAQLQPSPILSAVAPPPPPHPLAALPNADALPPTQILTLTVTETLTITVPAVVTPPPSRATKPPHKTKWRNPKRMDDLSAFNISAFSGGKDNLEIIQGIPPSMASFAVSSAPSEADANASSLILPRGHTHWPSDASTLQLLYPAGSINPAQRPIGGAQFYAAPLDLTHAHNVSLGYSAFFPADFDWVRGGKMPGLYGGRAGCSGGDEARDCWSTRLMWRSAGHGELYLYAPKSKQPPSLCSAAHSSSCSASYGLSIGRGSFTWAAGRWTRVTQTVTLNTPGRPDGCFVLDVDGVRVIERCDVFYRDVPPRTGPGAGAGEGDGGGRGGGIGGLLDGLLSDLFKRDVTRTRGAGAGEGEGSTFAATATAAAETEDYDRDLRHPVRMYEAQHGWAVHSTPTHGSTATVMADDEARPTAPPVTEDNDETLSAEAHGTPAVGFTGLFFSSFFGGHTARYATPTDQYVWFKDFYMSCNACQ